MEFVVDAKPNDASGEFDGVVRGRAANIDSAGRSDGAATVLELDVEIFDSGRDVLAECGLDAGAGRPASSDDRQSSSQYQTLHASPCEAVSNKYLICQRKGVTQKPQTEVFYTRWLIWSRHHT